MESKSVFATLNAINCNEHTEKKNGLTYLSWAWAWQMVKQNYPGATYTIYEDANGTPYFTDGRTAWVKTGVTIEGLEHIEYLPIMDFKNASIPLDKITSTDMNKTIQRSLTKACARHGLGLYIYAGEDIPEGEAEAPAGEKPKKKVTTTVKKEEAKEQPAPEKKEPISVKEAGSALEAMQMAQKAKSTEELKAVWNANKAKYGSDANFISAISLNPHNPNKRG